MIFERETIHFYSFHFRRAYKNVKIGDPLDDTTLCGPLHNQVAIETYKQTIEEATSQGGKILVGGFLDLSNMKSQFSFRCFYKSGKVLEDRDGNFVTPTIIQFDDCSAPVLKEERFVPILYVMKVSSLGEGIQLNNNVKQGLSSSLFTSNIQSAMKWIGPLGSDCGIVNVNIGTSGAEIGGAFGGEVSFILKIKN